MHFRRWHPVLAVALFALAACSSSQSLPSSPSSLQSGHPVTANNRNFPSFPKVLPMAKSYGVGLDVAAALIAGDNQWSKQYCANKSSSSCSAIVEHKTSFSFSASHSGSDKVNGGHFTVATQNTSGLAQSSYELDATAHGTPYTPGQDGGSGDAYMPWSDNLHVKSSTLRKGTAVTISVQLTIAPNVTSVSCTSDTNSEAALDYSGTGVDQYGSLLQVSGGCAAPGSFEYVVGSGGAGGQGTTDTGTINTTVGSTVAIGGALQVNGWACTFTFTCTGNYVTDLSGTGTWKITGISPAGVTYTTDSGHTY